MEDIITSINALLDEHRVILQKGETLDKLSRDAKATIDLEKAEDSLSSEHEQGLHKLQEMLETVTQELDSHFKREETSVLSAFEEHGNKNLSQALNALLNEHEVIRNHLSRSVSYVSDYIYINGKLLEKERGEGTRKIHDEVSNIRKLIDTHVKNENGLFYTVLEELGRQAKR